MLTFPTKLPRLQSHRVLDCLFPQNNRQVVNLQQSVNVLAFRQNKICTHICPPAQVSQKTSGGKYFNSRTRVCISKLPLKLTVYFAPKLKFHVWQPVFQGVQKCGNRKCGKPGSQIRVLAACPLHKRTLGHLG